MRLLLDTHILLWWLTDDHRLTDKPRSVIANTDNMIFVSSASIWEISIKRKLGKLTVPKNLEDYIARSGFEALNIRASHALLAGDLPTHHQDPFDRMLIAQSKIEELVLITHDRRLMPYKTKLLLNNKKNLN